MVFIKNSSLLIICLLSFTSLWAQPDLPDGQVEAIRDFEVRLIEVEKIDVRPALPPLDTTARSVTYQIPSKTVEVEYLPPKIRPIAMSSDRQVGDVYKGFLKLGYGNFNAPYAELSYNASDAKTYVVGGQVKHHSANNKDLENQRFRETFGKLYGTYYFDQGFSVNGNIGFTSDEVHFYGYDHSVDRYNREEIRQIFNNFDLDLTFANATKTQGDINYSVMGKLNTISDNFASKETNFLLDAKLEKFFNEKNPVSVRLITDFTNFQDTATQDLNNIFLIPSYTHHGDNFKVRAGIKIASHQDEFRFYPDIEASANVIGNKLAVFAGATGGLSKNNFKNVSDYNPFVQSRFMLENTDYRHFYGGIRGNLAVVQYEVQAGFKDADDLALFLTTPGTGIDSLRFDVLYDSVNIVNLQGTLKAQPIPNLEVHSTLGFNVYDMNKEEKPWHLPALELNIGGSYLMLEDKLKIKGEVFIQNGVPYRDLEGNVGNLNTLTDLSIGAEYQFAKNFGIFLDANNLLANKRERWFRYPTYGINVIGGITARF